MGAGRAGHGHADALSLTLSMDERNWLVDSGTFSYSSCKERDKFRGTAAHNTLRVDGMDQAETNGPFAWTRLPQVHARRWMSGETFAFFHGTHNGYDRLPDPVLHHRFVFHSLDGIYFVRDVLEGKQEHSLECNWHFAPDLKICEVEGNWIASPAAASGRDRPALALAIAQGWNCRSTEAMVSSAYGEQENAPLLTTCKRGRLPLELATIIRPVSLPFNETTKLTMQSPDRSVCTFRFDETQHSHCIFFSDDGGEWSAGPWSSDAEFVYVCARDGSTVHIVFCHGSFLRLGGNPVVQHCRTVEKFEWRGNGLRPISSGSHSDLSTFCPDVLRVTNLIC